MKIQLFIKAHKDVDNIKNSAANIVKTADSVRDNLATMFIDISSIVGCELEPSLAPQVRRKHRKAAAADSLLPSN
jgi:hypothetical protein